jgi:hypothetical protein
MTMESRPLPKLACLRSAQTQDLWQNCCMGATSDLLDDGFEALTKILAEGPELELHRDDAGWQIVGESGAGSLTVAARTRFTPRIMDQLTTTAAPGRSAGVLVLAPWLSTRSQAAIQATGWNYLDLTGNALIRLHSPALYVRLTGADVDPQPRPRSQVQLRGAQINALVRLLVDVEPPYRLSDLALASGLSKGYLSRALTSLFSEKLVERAGSGPVTGVDWLGLLRLRAREYDLFTSNRSATFLSRRGTRALLDRLADDPDAVVTGSFAASKINPVAAPAQLAIYVPDIRAFQRKYELYPTRAGSNVLLLEPSSQSQLGRSLTIDGVRQVGHSQLVLDLLGGNGRLPEEGEAIIEWMIDTPGWRLPALPDN